MKIVLYKNSDDTVSIIYSTPGISDSKLLSFVPVGLSSLLIEDTDLPTEDMTRFMSVLTADFDSPTQPNIRIDLTKAKELVKNDIRQYRQSKFAINDLAIRDAMLADDKEQLATAIKERDRLRNLPNIVNRARSLEDLKSLKIE
jgi:hypothetical protein